jgi:hypothetical protein
VPKKGTGSILSGSIVALGGVVDKGKAAEKGDSVDLAKSTLSPFLPPTKRMEWSLAIFTGIKK